MNYFNSSLGTQEFHCLVSSKYHSSPSISVTAQSGGLAVVFLLVYFYVYSNKRGFGRFSMMTDC